MYVCAPCDMPQIIRFQIEPKYERQIKQKGKNKKLINKKKIAVLNLKSILGRTMETFKAL